MITIKNIFAESELVSKPAIELRQKDSQFGVLNYQ